jgi:hypothetical protein
LTGRTAVLQGQLSLGVAPEKFGLFVRIKTGKEVKRIPNTNSAKVSEFVSNHFVRAEQGGLWRMLKNRA